MTPFFVKIYFKLIAISYWLLSPLPLSSMWSPRSRACPVMWTCGTSLQWQQHNTQSSSGIDKVKQLLKSLKLAVCPVQKGKHKAQLPSWLIALSLLNSLLGFIVWTWLTKKFWYINNSLRLARKYARIFDRGHYLFREANSFLWALRNR